MIKLEHVSKSYTAGIPALNDVSLDIEEGEFVFIVGDSAPALFGSCSETGIVSL